MTAAEEEQMAHQSIAEDLAATGQEMGGVKRRKKKGSAQLPPEVAGILGEANEAFMEEDHDTAIKLLLEVIHKAPRFSGAYHTLGLIYEEIGEVDQALQVRHASLCVKFIGIHSVCVCVSAHLFI